MILSPPSQVQLTLRTGKAFLREDGIFQIELRPNELFNLEDVKELKREKAKICGKKRLPNLWIIGAYTNPDHEAREFAARERK
jgi:hypothetical protein